MTANAYSQRELVADISPDVARCTVSAEIRCGLSGEAIRLKFREEYARDAVEYCAVSVQKGEEIRKVTFCGADGFMIQPGQSVLSDSLNWQIESGQTLKIYICYGESFSKSETSLEQTHSCQGDYTLEGYQPVEYKNPLPGVPFTERLCGLKEVQIYAEEKSAAIAVLGDSIAEMGVWVDPLRERIRKLHPEVTLLNYGIGGNRLLRDTNVPAFAGQNAFGKSALSRLDEDLFEAEGIGAVILAMGINDIAQPGGPLGFSPPQEEICSADSLIFGLKEALNRCREKKLKVAGVTITPFKGYETYKEESAAIRREVNRWILESGEFDLVIDLAAYLADPSDPEQLIPNGSIGDNLHPGFEIGAMAANKMDADAICRLVIA